MLPGSREPDRLVGKDVGDGCQQQRLPQLPTPWLLPGRDLPQVLGGKVTWKRNSGLPSSPRSSLDGHLCLSHQEVRKWAQLGCVEDVSSTWIESAVTQSWLRAVHPIACISASKK